MEPSAQPETSADDAVVRQEETPDDPDDDAGEYLTLDQILTTKSEMITESQPAPDKAPDPQPRPGERMTQMASDLADMISDINERKIR